MAFDFFDVWRNGGSGKLIGGPLDRTWYSDDVDDDVDVDVDPDVDVDVDVADSCDFCAFMQSAFRPSHFPPNVEE